MDGGRPDAGCFHGRPPLCAVVLAAGEGRRLRPLTTVRPKALCPVGNVPLLDRMLTALEQLGLRGPELVAVNASWLAEQVVQHVGDRAHLSVEPGGPIGTAGALGRLRSWVDGRGVLAGNADAYLANGRTLDAGVAALLEGWDGTTVRLLGVPTRPDDPYRFGRHRFAGLSLLPWPAVAALDASVPAPTELVREVWRPYEAAGKLEVTEHSGVFMDTGTPATYLAANLHAAARGGSGSLIDPTAKVAGQVDRAVVGAEAVVEGALTRTVVWPGGYVGPDEHLTDAVRVGRDLTVSARQATRAGRPKPP
ncbi:MAG TPA: sugar phosphate nucleotidyltransferase [Micromonosporaceae bacterium]|nr:sugar phosphate nucleotidyltransferase [Micromonosporaceae bacterium]